MNSLIILWKMLAEDLASRCCTSATRDIETVAGRAEKEGISFLTITLPAFGKDFEACLAEGAVRPHHFLGFRRGRVGLPAFLGGFLGQVFDRNSGVLLHDVNIDAIHAVRQLTLVFGKIDIACSDKRRRLAMRAFVECEKEVKSTSLGLSDEDIRDFVRVGRLLFGKVLSGVDRDIDNMMILPKHGPGATADRLIGNQKFSQSEWTARLEKVFPMSDHLIPNYSFWEDLEAVDLLEPGAERPVKVISVPKTQKTPRIIAIEPTCMQYMQQGILESMVQRLREDKTAHRLVGSESQVPNQRLAKEGSLTGELATLDLSEASDRVSYRLVQALTSCWPSLHEALDATRSRTADVPEEGVITLSKYASMGSALCFPVEAMVFCTMIFVGIEKGLNRRLTTLDVRRLRGRVRVYGDDIIVPADYVHPVVAELERFGAKVNSGKSFWTGWFRESCGREYYAGEDVSIVRVRQLFPARRGDATEVISLVSLRNQLYWAGLWGPVKWLDGILERLLRHYPAVTAESPVLGRQSVLGYDTERLHRDLHSPLVRGWVVSAKSPVNEVDGRDALLKWFLKRGNEPFLDVDHLTRSGRPQRVDIKLRMASPF